jgi:hypothetical protein
VLDGGTNLIVTPEQENWAIACPLTEHSDDAPLHVAARFDKRAVSDVRPTSSAERDRSLHGTVDVPQDRAVSRQPA